MEVVQKSLVLSTSQNGYNGVSDGAFSAGAHGAGVLGSVGVRAAGTIPAGGMTAPIEAHGLVGAVLEQQFSVKLSPQKLIDLENPSTPASNQHWVRAIKLADDCHSYNIQLKFHPSNGMYANFKCGVVPKLILQAVRNIECGEELLLWFSEDILTILGMAFLYPSNIHDQNKYFCTRCHAFFPSPNPLKIHISLRCDRLPQSTLWGRLAGVMMNGTDSNRNVDFKFNLPVKGQVLDLSVDGGVKSSAFKPFKKQTSTPLHQNLAPVFDVVNPTASYPIIFETDVVQLHRNLLNPYQALTAGPKMYSDNDQMETLVSSLGKSKQGHICLYCGKCYSRKYGLKIHIRTHTGYKPLKCKFCDRHFGDPSNLNKHIRLHDGGNTPYKCNLCSKILVRRRDLERHLKSRHSLPLPVLADSTVNENSNSTSMSMDSDDVTNIDTSCAPENDVRTEEVQVLEITEEEESYYKIK